STSPGRTRTAAIGPRETPPSPATQSRATDYASAVVLYLDVYVGIVMDRLTKLGLLDN
ncbi:unnamed protein product, partial [Phaeothamnion confervicola]